MYQSMKHREAADHSTKQLTPTLASLSSQEKKFASKERRKNPPRDGQAGATYSFQGVTEYQGKLNVPGG